MSKCYSKSVYKILTALQYAFYKGFSCRTQLLVTLYDLIHYKVNNAQTDIVTLDLLKALDTVPHDKLLDILRRYRITSDTLVGY